MTEAMKKNLETIKNAMSEFSYVGLRGVCYDMPEQVGEYLAPSYDWDLENDCSCRETTGDDLGGTCALDLGELYDAEDEAETAEMLESVISRAEDYGDKIIVVVGNRREYGNDENEIIIENAIYFADIEK